MEFVSSKVSSFMGFSSRSVHGLYVHGLNPSEVTFSLLFALIFLGNDKNKKRFISMLISKLDGEHITVHQATEDADRLIVTTAIDMSARDTTVTVVGEDIDLLVLLVGLSAPDNIYYFKPGRGKSKSIWYQPRSLVNERIAHNILFLHAVTGCDTTSSLYGQGKAKCFKVLEKHPQLSHELSLFKTPSTEASFQQDSMLLVGEKFIAALYGETSNIPLDDLRYKVYKTALFKSAVKMESLPPTTDSAHQHLLRVYLQVQLWLGVSPKPDRFGWDITPNGLQPIMSTKPPAPDKLLAVVACKCKKGCNKMACSCKKAGLFCSRLCASCDQPDCGNVDQRSPDDDREEVDDDHLELPDQEELPQDEEPPEEIMIEESQPGPSQKQRQST